MAPPNLDFDLNGTQCQAEIFGDQFYCLSIGLFAGYVFLVLIFSLGGATLFLCGLLAGRRPSDIAFKVLGALLLDKKGSHLFLTNKAEPELTPPGSYRYDLLKNPTLSPRSRHRVPSAVPLRPQRHKSYLSRYWAWHGRMVARYASICLYINVVTVFYVHIPRYPITVICVCLLFTGICGLGIMQLEIEERPEKLWVSSSSRAAQDKADFDANFGNYQCPSLFLLCYIWQKPRFAAHNRKV